MTIILLLLKFVIVISSKVLIIHLTFKYLNVKISALFFFFFYNKYF